MLLNFRPGSHIENSAQRGYIAVTRPGGCVHL